MSEAGRRLCHNIKSLGTATAVREKEAGYVCNFTLTIVVLFQCSGIVINNILIVYYQNVIVCHFTVMFKRHIPFRGNSLVFRVSFSPPLKSISLFTGSQ